MGAVPPPKEPYAKVRDQSPTPDSILVEKLSQFLPGQENSEDESLGQENNEDPSESHATYREDLIREAFRSRNDDHSAVGREHLPKKSFFLNKNERFINTPRTQNTNQPRFQPRKQVNIDTAGQLLQLLLNRVQEGNVQGQRKDTSYYAITNVPKPKVVDSLHEAQILADQFDEHVSVFPTYTKAVEYVTSAREEKANITEDLFKSAGVDESTGKGIFLFGHRITTDAELRNFLVPHNLDKGTSILLSDLMLDSLAYPGAVKMSAKITNLSI